MYFQRKLIVCMEEGYVFLFVVTTSSLFDNGHQQQTQTTGCYWFLQRQQKVLFGGQETSINPWKPVRTIVQTWQDKWDSNETASCSLSFCLQTGTDWLHLAHCCCGLTYIHTKSGCHTGKSIYTGFSVWLYPCYFNCLKYYLGLTISTYIYLFCILLLIKTLTWKVYICTRSFETATAQNPYQYLMKASFYFHLFTIRKFRLGCLGYISTKNMVFAKIRSILSLVFWSLKLCLNIG